MNTRQEINKNISNGMISSNKIKKFNIELLNKLLLLNELNLTDEILKLLNNYPYNIIK